MFVVSSTYHSQLATVYTTTALNNTVDEPTSTATMDQNISITCTTMGQNITITYGGVYVKQGMDFRMPIIELEIVAPRSRKKQPDYVKLMTNQYAIARAGLNRRDSQKHQQSRHQQDRTRMLRIRRYC
jgi:hypothetical protein